MLNKEWQNIVKWKWTITSGQWVWFYLDAKIGDYDITNNRTPIYTRLRSTLNAGTAGGTKYQFTCSYAPTVEGNGVYYFGNKTITETNSEQYVNHNDDGTASVTLSSYLYNGYLGLSQTISGTATLPTIPRKSTVTATNATIGGTCSININQKSDSFTHTLRYSFGSLSGTIANGVKYSYGWIIPTDFYSQIPNSPSGTLTIYCDTYNGSTLIGTNSTTTTVSANENESRPSVSISAKDINPTTSQLTSGADESNIILKGFSNVQIVWSSTSKNSASISNNIINGNSVSESPTTLNSVDTNIFTLTSTDSRGFSNSKSTTNETNPLVDYINLRIDPVNFYRLQPTNGKVALTFQGNYFNDTFGNVENTLNLSYKFREKGSSTEWDDIESVSLEGKYYIENNVVYSGTTTNRVIELEGTFDYKKQYEFRLYYADKLISTYVDKNIPKGQPIFWWDEHGLYDSVGNKYITLNDVYPIGSVYITFNSENPNTIFGGTWERLKETFLWSAGDSDTIGSKGGEKTHLLTSAESGQKDLGTITTGTESASHTHTITTGGYSFQAGSAVGAYSTATSGSTQGKDTQDYTYTGGENSNHNHSFSIGGSNATQAHNNMPPYTVVYMWRRTA